MFISLHQKFILIHSTQDIIHFKGLRKKFSISKVFYIEKFYIKIINQQNLINKIYRKIEHFNQHNINEHVKFCIHSTGMYTSTL